MSAATEATTDDTAPLDAVTGDAAAADAAAAAAVAVAATGSPRRHAVFHRLRVAAVEPLTDDAVAVTFDVPPDLRPEFRFRAGQHLTVRAPAIEGDVRRNYSICAPATGDRLRIGVKRVPGGAFSTYVTEQLAPGDELEVMTPTGTFCPDLDPGSARRYVAVAAGSGITPVLSILATALEVEPASTAALVLVNRRASTIMFLEELEDLKDTYPDRFQLLHVLHEEASEVELLSGRLDVDRLHRILDALVPPQDVDAWFLCGPLALTESVRGALLERGVEAGRVHRELFFVGDAPAPRRPRPVDPRPTAGAEVTVLLDGRSTTFRLPRDGVPVLEATLAARPDAPFACKNGVCGTCRAHVVEGAVEMDTNYALEPEELERGVVLTCQAHPVTDRLVVDYDR
ncbi:phenylacetate-CoA oxygenase/reductase subunit PaaK [Actinotalea ferrariae]|uniref:1,2-phenylacetyl-CoA epoxidase subunit PaaE n=1 Tax=Actinotalea ferrariae TaxID=1386098 RepID=UPI001C8C44DA|nr:1,2-phenylacetyl-CoA epoxidase subunit PaaE [Actinotalea ferrariae]MBX9245230.1 phenylacetate-CoA oxygenase/reductase subunit PaaK [Actinotalea ferrariae]